MEKIIIKDYGKDSKKYLHCEKYTFIYALKMEDNYREIIGESSFWVGKPFKL